MADLKITDLTVAATLADDDTFEIARDPSGTPLSRSVTALAIAAYMHDSPTLTDPDLGDATADSLQVGPFGIFSNGLTTSQSTLASENGSAPVDGSTSNATPTAIDTYAVIPPISQEVVIITWTIGAHFAGPEVAAYQVTAVYMHNGSSLSLVGTPTKTVLAESAGATALDVTADANAGNARLIATGIAATNIAWSSTRKAFYVAS